MSLFKAFRRKNRWRSTDSDTHKLLLLFLLWDSILPLDPGGLWPWGFFCSHSKSGKTEAFSAHSFNDCSAYQREWRGWPGRKAAGALLDPLQGEWKSPSVLLNRPFSMKNCYVGFFFFFLPISFLWDFSAVFPCSSVSPLPAGILHSLRVPWTARSPAWWTQVGLGAWGCEVFILQCSGVTAPAFPGKIILVMDREIAQMFCFLNSENFSVLE